MLNRDNRPSDLKLITRYCFSWSLIMSIYNLWHKNDTPILTISSIGIITSRKCQYCPILLHYSRIVYLTKKNITVVKVKHTGLHIYFLFNESYTHIVISHKLPPFITFGQCSFLLALVLYIGIMKIGGFRE